MNQNEIFVNKEGNQWFQRNHDALIPERDDLITRALQRLQLRPKKIAEVGCSNGWRLEKLRCLFSADCFGLEASEEAVAFAHEKYPLIRVKRQDISRMAIKETFDLVICNFVFHWIDRVQLLPAVSRVDALVKWGGI